MKLYIPFLVLIAFANSDTLQASSPGEENLRLTRRSRVPANRPHPLRQSSSRQIERPEVILPRSNTTASGLSELLSLYNENNEAEASPQSVTDPTIARPRPSRPGLPPTQAMQPQDDIKNNLQP